MGSGIGASLTTFSPNTTIQSSPANNNFSALNAGGISNDGVITTSGGGDLQNVNSIAFNVGSISRIWHVTSQATSNGKTTITHGLGATPDVVLITFNAAGVPTSGAQAGYNPATLSSSSVDIWANGLYNVDVTLMKF